ncbi:MAG TPA: gamma carbonic anhydrase family protein [Alphaproteobacteria bacterium]|nr:gamma carbonic anhydrase family protein [Alphaproteobacteria bacterium]
MNPTILPYKGIYPQIHETAFIAPNATIIGDVVIGEYSSVWPGCVIRGDVNIIRIGKRTNIQDGTIIHVTRPSIAGEGGQTIIGDNITVGHSATIHACTLEDECFVGMSATILDGAIVKKGAMLAAGALLTPKKQVLGCQIWAGNPAKYMRDMTDGEKAFIMISAENYVNDAKAHKESY